MVPTDMTSQDGLKSYRVVEVINQILTALSTVETFVPNAIPFGGNSNTGRLTS